RPDGLLAQRWADVDHALVLDRDEARADSHRHVLDVGEDLVARLAAIADVHGDLQLAHRARVKACLTQFQDQPVAIGNSCRFDLEGVAHQPGLSLTRRPRNSVETRYVPGAMAVATREYGLFIGGEPAEPASGETRDLVEPATGAALATVAQANEQDVDRAVDAARGALNGDWGKTPPTERSRLLHALADALVANRKELAELEARNVGKAISSVKAELAQAVETFRFYASAIGSIAGRSNPIGGSIQFYSLKEPVGVCAQIVPWNYPLMLPAWKLAPALAAGC